MYENLRIFNDYSDISLIKTLVFYVFDDYSIIHLLNRFNFDNGFTDGQG